MNPAHEDPIVYRPRDVYELAPSDLHTLRVLSWNVYRNNRPEDIEESLMRFVRAHEPHVILLQEAPVYELSGFADLEVLDGYFEIYEPMHIMARPSGPSGPTSVGQLTFSKLPYIETTAYLLPPIRFRFGRKTSSTSVVRRVALYTQIAMEDGTRVGLYNVHFENRALPEGRYKQARHLITIIESREDDVVIVGGDFNTFLTKTFELSLHLFYEAGFVNVFRDERRRLLPRLDYFMVRGAESTRILPLRGRGSDHQPIMADVVL